MEVLNKWQGRKKGEEDRKNIHGTGMNTTHAEGSEKNGTEKSPHEQGLPSILFFGVSSRVCMVGPDAQQALSVC